MTLRTSITILFLAALVSGRAELILSNTYVVVSDIYDENIPEGKCILRGKVYEAYGETPVGGGYVSDISQKRSAVVNAEGNYEVKLLATDSAFFFFHQEYGEIICWNYDFKSKHVVTVNFITGLKRNDLVPVAEKPVIYLYSQEPVEAKLTLNPLGHLSFSYPKYNGGWEVWVQNNNISVDDKVYPYLFWEANLNQLQFKTEAGEMEGYFIQTDSTVQFLEHTLETLGLNDTEKTDFITYWAPRIMHYPYATVQFLVDTDYETDIASLLVQPKPDAQRRIYLVFEGSTIKQDLNYLKTPHFKPFIRSGFTLVEWGGSELNK